MNSIENSFDTPDDAEFFKSLISKIGSSLDMEIVLQRLCDFLLPRIPISAMSLNTLDWERYEVRQVAGISLDSALELQKIVPISYHLLQRLDQESSYFHLSASARQQVYVLNDPESIPLLREMGELNDPDISTIRVPLQAPLSDYFLVINTVGKNRFTDEHARIAILLSNPMSIALSNALKYSRLITANKLLLNANTQLSGARETKLADFISGRYRGLQQVVQMVHSVADTETPILILGETGVGKELVATAIHSLSAFAAGPFIKVNCGAIPEQLIDSELFGHERGSFTGATNTYHGFFERAQNGTIFLDEIGELPLSAQVRLLRVLQFREIERVGGTKPIRLKIRILAATHRDLEKMVQEGAFREDLLFRLNIIPIEIPPLRHRKQDIPDLMQQILAMKCQEMGMQSPVEITPESIEVAMRHDWPGNIRELENSIERGLILNRGKRILQLTTSRKNDSVPAPHNALPGITQTAPSDFPTLDDAIRLHISKALQLCNGIIHGPRGAAKLLGLNSHTLRARMVKLGMIK